VKRADRIAKAATELAAYIAEGVPRKRLAEVIDRVIREEVLAALRLGAGEARP
jgi:hypothetical protein